MNKLETPFPLDIHLLSLVCNFLVISHIYAMPQWHRINVYVLNEKRGPRATDEYLREKGFHQTDILVEATDGWYVWEKIPLSTALYHKRWWKPIQPSETTEKSWKGS